MLRLDDDLYNAMNDAHHDDRAPSMNAWITELIRQRVEQKA